MIDVDHLNVVLRHTSAVSKRERAKELPNASKRSPGIRLGRPLWNVQLWDVVTPQPAGLVIPLRDADCAIVRQDGRGGDATKNPQTPLTFEPVKIQLRKVPAEADGTCSTPPLTLRSLIGLQISCA